MLKILFKHLNNDMKLLNCDLFWFCIFCKSEIFRLNNQITYVLEIIFRQFFFFISFSLIRLNQILTSINHVYLQMWRKWCNQFWLKQQCIWCYLQTERWDCHSHYLNIYAAQFSLSETQSLYIMNLFRLLCRIHSLININKVHFMCFLSKHIFHSDSFDFFKTCAYDKLILQIMLFIIECQLQ